MQNLLVLLAAASVILLTLGVGGGVSDMILKRSKRFNRFADDLPMMYVRSENDARIRTAQPARRSDDGERSVQRSKCLGH